MSLIIIRWYKYRENYIKNLHNALPVDVSIEILIIAS